ncbi:MAG: hypothetical protein IBJ09_02845 [Bacteroidia bacterium]|nr:hypothetical protein [Bacteroidia bacterium]
MRICIHTLFLLAATCGICRLSYTQAQPYQSVDLYFSEAGKDMYKPEDMLVLPDGSVLIATHFRTEYTDSIRGITWQRKKSGGGLIWLNARLEKERELVFPDYNIDRLVHYKGRTFLAGNAPSFSWRYDPAWVAEINRKGEILWEKKLCRTCAYAYMQDMTADSAGNLYALLLKERDYIRERVKKVKVPAGNGRDSIVDIISVDEGRLKLYSISPEGKRNWQAMADEPNYEGLWDAELKVTGSGFDISFYDLTLMGPRHTWMRADRKVKRPLPFSQDKIYLTHSGALTWNTDAGKLKWYEAGMLKNTTDAPETAYGYLPPDHLLPLENGGYFAFNTRGYNFNCTWLDKDLRIQKTKNYPGIRKVAAKKVQLMPDGSVLVLNRSTVLPEYDPDKYMYIKLLRLEP